MIDEAKELVNVLTEAIENWLDVAPAYVRNLTHRFAVYHIVWYSFAFIACIAMLIWGVKLIKKWEEEYEDGYIGFWWTLIVLAIWLWIASIICLLRAIFVPEIALIHAL